eukprot:scaffold616705_cov17-Prasinocladus_malaysianus.AAC.1
MAIITTTIIIVITIITTTTTTRRTTRLKQGDETLHVISWRSRPCHSCPGRPWPGHWAVGP